MNAPHYESIWQKSLIRVTDKFSLPPIVLRVDDAVIGTLGNFSDRESQGEENFQCECLGCLCPR